MYKLLPWRTSGTSVTWLYSNEYTVAGSTAQMQARDLFQCECCSYWFGATVVALVRWRCGTGAVLIQCGCNTCAVRVWYLCGAGLVLVQCGFGACAVWVRCLCSAGSVLVHCGFGACALRVRYLFSAGSVLVWCGFGAVLTRCGTLTFYCSLL